MDSYKELAGKVYQKINEALELGAKTEPFGVCCLADAWQGLINRDVDTPEADKKKMAERVEEILELILEGLPPEKAEASLNIVFSIVSLRQMIYGTAPGEKEASVAQLRP